MTFGTKGFRAVKKAFKPVVASRQFHASRSSRGDQWPFPEDGTAGGRYIHGHEVRALSFASRTSF